MTSGGETVPLEGGLPGTSDSSPAKEFNSANLSNLLGRLLRGVAFDHVLSKVLAIAAQAEQAVSDVVAIQLGRDEECMEILAYEVFGHVPNDKKLKILERTIAARGWAADFPEVVSTLQRLHTLRNQLAHSYSAEEPGARHDDAIYHRRTYWHGREKDLDIDAEEVFTLAEAVEKILSEDLTEIARRSLPQPMTGSTRALRRGGSPATLLAVDDLLNLAQGVIRTGRHHA